MRLDEFSQWAMTICLKWIFEVEDVRKVHDMSDTLRRMIDGV